MQPHLREDVLVSRAGAGQLPCGPTGDLAFFYLCYESYILLVSQITLLLNVY